MECPFVLGVDIGGSHITTALVNVDERALIADSIQRKTIDSQASANIILDAWCEVISNSFIGYPTLAKHIGIAMPGPFDYENGICLIKEQDKFQALYNCNIKTELASRLAIDPSNIHFINDAAAFLQGEVFAGGATTANNVLGFTLGTGLGSAFCTNGIAIDIALWNAPFLTGTAEDYLSTKWFKHRYFQLTGKQLTGVKELLGLVPVDEPAAQVFNEFGDNLAQFMMPIIKTYKANTVILGGNIAQAFSVFTTNLENILIQNQFNAEVKVTTLNEHAALIGAASCCRIKI
jgi:glucokinase